MNRYVIHLRFESFAGGVIYTRMICVAEDAQEVKRKYHSSYKRAGYVGSNYDKNKHNLRHDDLGLMLDIEEIEQIDKQTYEIFDEYLEELNE